MRRITVLAIGVSIAACSLAGTPETSRWRYDPAQGYVGENEVLTEAEFLERCRKTAKEHQALQAARMFDLLAAHSQELNVKEEAYFQRSRMLTEAMKWLSAYAKTEEFLKSFPGSALEKDAQRQLFEIARLMIAAGDDKAGIEKMRETLKTYYGTDFAPQYALWMAEFFFVRGRIEEANYQYKFIVDEYFNRPEVPAAIFRMGECELKSYRGPNFDMAPLKKALEKYQKVIDDYSGTQAAQQAQQRKQFIFEQYASKEFRDGEYYEARGHKVSAAVFYRYILATYPKTSYAQRARDRLKELGMPVQEAK